MRWPVTGTTLFMLCLWVACGDAPPERRSVPREPAGGPWPSFRGSFDLCGVAAGAVSVPLEVQWTYRAKSLIRSAPVVDRARVYFGTGDGRLIALDRRRGRPDWQVQKKYEFEAPPLIYDGAVYVGNADTNLYAFDAANGRERWRFRCEDRILGSVTVAGAGMAAARLIIGSYDNRVYALDPADGRELWRVETDNFVNGAAAAAGGRIVIGSCDGVLRVLSRDGKNIRRIRIGRYIAGSAALKEGTAYFGHYREEIMAVSVIDGRTLWRTDDDGRLGAVVATPAVDDDLVIIGSRAAVLLALDRKTGQVEWRFRASAGIDGSAVIVGNKVVFGSGDGRLYVLRRDDGRLLFEYEIGSPILTTPAVAYNQVYVTAKDGSVWAFRTAR